MKLIKTLKITFFLIFILSSSFAKNNYFSEGLIFFKKKDFDKAKFKFEQDIIFNPKSEKSYLFLSKIYNAQKKVELEEQNLNTVILLNPENEDALFNLAELKLSESNYKESKGVEVLFNTKNLKSVKEYFSSE